MIRLKEEYPNADFGNIETMKQIVINKFKENNLPLSKIKKGKIDGIFVYHPNGDLFFRDQREKVSETNCSVTYRRFKVPYRCSFIATDDFESFENFLEMAIVESRKRRDSE